MPRPSFKGWSRLPATPGFRGGAGRIEQGVAYDAWNRMVAIKVGSTVKIAYEYDGLFRRVQETVGTTVHSQYYSAS